MGTARRHARGDGLADFDQTRARVIFLRGDDFRDNLFAGDGVGDEDDAPGFVASHRLAALGIRPVRRLGYRRLASRKRGLRLPKRSRLFTVHPLLPIVFL